MTEILLDIVNEFKKAFINIGLVAYIILLLPFFILLGIIGGTLNKNMKNQYD